LPDVKSKWEVVLELQRSLLDFFVCLVGSDPKRWYTVYPAYINSKVGYSLFAYSDGVVDLLFAVGLCVCVCAVEDFRRSSSARQAML
jgi:hypothetical protein